MCLPCPILFPENINGFIHIETESESLKIFFSPLAQIPEKQIQILLNFLYTHRIPDFILHDIDKNELIIIDTQILNMCTIFPSQNKICFFSSNNENKNEKILKFDSIFYLMTFLNQISITHFFELVSDNTFMIKPISNIDKDNFYKIIVKNSTTNQNLDDDLKAHSSLLEFLNFSSDAPSILIPFDSSIFSKLLESPDDEKSLTILSKSSIPPFYAPLLIVILLLDSPLLESESNSLLDKSYSNLSLNDEDNFQKSRKRLSSSSFAFKRFNGIIPDLPPLKISPKKLFIVDEMSIGGSLDICTDYSAIKNQWKTITKSQIKHMPNLKISMKLLEKNLFETYQKGHPLIEVIFNAMTSHFLMRDKFESYLSEFYYTMSSIAQLFHPINKIIDFDATDIEHFVFWLFTSLISKTGIVEIIDQRDPSQLLNKAFRIVMGFHPLMYQLIEHSDLSSYKFAASIVYSLYSNVIKGPKLWVIWASALVSDDAMWFFQSLLAMALMMIYPNVIGSKNIIEAVNNNLKLFFEKTDADVLISNTLKLINEYGRNG